MIRQYPPDQDLQPEQQNSPNGAASKHNGGSSTQIKALLTLGTLMPSMVGAAVIATIAYLMLCLYRATAPDWLYGGIWIGGVTLSAMVSYRRILAAQIAWVDHKLSDPSLRDLDRDD